MYGIRCMQALMRGGHELHCTVSQWGEQVVRRETGRSFAEWAAELGIAAGHIHDSANLAAPPASGSFRLDGTLIVPCSMSSIGAIAAGTAGSLVHRAALVSLKEGRPLLLCPRETPLSLIGLKNLTALAEAGAVILPLSPAFYHSPQNINDLLDFITGKILDRLGIEHTLVPRWQG
jgi:4-hydroxy-3-polyprenylbenzoate decarboxylase